MKRGIRRVVASALVALFVLGFAIGPVSWLVASAFPTAGGLPGFLRVVIDPLNTAALINSLEQGALSAALAVALGYPLGVLLSRYAWPGSQWLRSLLLVPFLLPSLVVVVGVADLTQGFATLSNLGPTVSRSIRGLPAILLVNVVYNGPLVALLTALSLEGAKPELEEAVATLGGGAFRQYRDGWGPASWLGALAGALLTFLLSALAFAGPLLLGGAKYSTLEVRVWALDQTLLQPDQAALLALWTMAVLSIPAVLYLWVSSRIRPPRGRAAPRFRRIRWTSPFAWAMLIPSVILGTLIGGMFLSVLLGSVRAPGGSGWSSAGWEALFGTKGESALGIPASAVIANTALFAVAAAGIALLVGVVAGFEFGTRTQRPRAVVLLAFAPLLISPVILAFGLAQAWEPITGGAESVWFWIIISQSTLALPFVIQSLAGSLAQLPEGVRDAAETLGASPVRSYLEVELPGAVRGLVGAGLFGMAIGLGEFTATNFLATPSFTTLSVAIPHLEELRLAGAASAAAALLLILSAGIFLVLVRGGRTVEL